MQSTDIKKLIDFLSSALWRFPYASIEARFENG